MKKSHAPVGIHARELKARKASSTTGKSKGLVPKPTDRAMARNSRSYKSRDYRAWCTKMDGRKSKK